MLVEESARRVGLPVELVRLGSVRQLREEISSSHQSPHRVLFWREASRENGGDICVHAFRTLAPKYPDVVFTLAIRPYVDEVPGIDALAREFENVEVFRFPYEGALRLPELLAESLLVFLPFRSQSIHPQLSVMESLEAGVPAIVLDVGDMREVVSQGKTGLLANPEYVCNATALLEQALSNPDLIGRMRAKLSSGIDSAWDWDVAIHRLEEIYEELVGEVPACGHRDA